jgi:hypothetical protein
MAFCGGNGMGFLNVDAGLFATGFSSPDGMVPGPVTFVSHSGSAFAALAFNDRAIRFNLLVSSGQEIVTTMADYVRYALERETTRVIALLLETVRDPAGLREAFTEADERGIPVIALKVGRTEGSKAMVTAHSGALAGEHGAQEVDRLGDPAQRALERDPVPSLHDPVRRGADAERETAAGRIGQGGRLLGEERPAAGEHPDDPRSQADPLGPCRGERERREPVRPLGLAAPQIGVAGRLRPPDVLLVIGERHHRERQRESPAAVGHARGNLSPRALVC